MGRGSERPPAAAGGNGGGGGGGKSTAARPRGAGKDAPPDPDPDPAPGVPRCPPRRGRAAPALLCHGGGAPRPPPSPGPAERRGPAGARPLRAPDSGRGAAQLRRSPPRRPPHTAPLPAAGIGPDRTGPGLTFEGAGGGRGQQGQQAPGEGQQRPHCRRLGGGAAAAAAPHAVLPAGRRVPGPRTDIRGGRGRGRGRGRGGAGRADPPGWAAAAAPGAAGRGREGGGVLRAPPPPRRDGGMERAPPPA